MPLGLDGRVNPDPGPPSPPAVAQVARAFTVLQAGLPLFFSVGHVSLLVFPAGTVSRSEHLAWAFGSLTVLALVVSSVAGMGKRRPWAWRAALLANVLTATAWVAGIVWLAVDPGQKEGMAFFSGVVVGLPMIAIAGATAVLLVLPRVWRYYLARG
jgi:hypothetical protein